MQPLALGEIAATPWPLHPLWFCVMALAIPAAVWLVLAWRRVLLECPNRIRRAGVKEMKRLLKKLQRSDRAPQPAHLHAWLRATARAWDVRTSAPCVGEVTEAAHALTGDPSVSARWRELWQQTEHGLYAPDAHPAPDWLERAISAAATVGVPKRQRWFPNRLADWVPCVVLSTFVLCLVAAPVTDADVPWSAPPVSEPAAAEFSTEQSSAVSEALDEDIPTEEMPQVVLSPDDAQAARAALQAHWNDWAAHRNLAAYLTQEGDLNRAIAHATAAFVQHPSASVTRETLLAAYGETPSVDPNLRRMLSGPWYQRLPTLFSPAGWQRLALVAGLIVAAGLSAMIIAWYLPAGGGVRVPAHWSSAGRAAAAVGTVVMLMAVSNWNAYGTLSQPAAAILLRNANASPVPTELVPVEETSPLAAGAVVLTHGKFLGWREVSSKRPEVSGWIRSSAVMPLYAGRQ
jgi:hypothetical protein